MKRTISSLSQSIFKMFTLFFVGVFSLVLLSFGLDSLFTLIFSGRLPDFRMRWDDIVLPLGFLGMFLWFAISRRTVQMDERNLYVSVFRRMVVIPREQIAEVTETIGVKDRSVTVYFRIKTPFGRSITFTPTLVLSLDARPASDCRRASTSAAV